MPRISYYEYVNTGGNNLFTMVILPSDKGKFPTVILRTPYVGYAENKAERDLLQDFSTAYENYLERGYAVVLQHCRGCGKSTGGFVPYVFEREDGLLLRSWIRSKDFYNGELFLVGASYTASLHYATAPFEKDVIAAVFEVQDSERYNLWYRNGQMRKGHANWHFGLYKCSPPLAKAFNMQSFAQLPLEGLSETALGKRAEDFELMLNAPSPSDEFWLTRNGGSDARDVLSCANIPILLTTGYNDFYVGGVFKMWEKMDEQTKSKSALLVSPYNHGDSFDSACGLCFDRGRRSEQFGEHYALDWLDNARTNSPLLYKKGVITYYRVFENSWAEDFYKIPTSPCKIGLGDKPLTFSYDPLCPTAFTAEGCFASENNDEKGFLRVYTPPFEQDCFVKGQMQVDLTVSSNCLDTSFYVRIGIRKENGCYTLRHDITSLCYQLGKYNADDIVKLNFTFDEYAFAIKKGDVLQIDIASTDDNSYVSHTNNCGKYHKQTSAVQAQNTVYLDKSYLTLPIEN